MINSWVPAATDSTLCPHHLAAVLEDSEPVSPQAAEGSPEVGSALDKSQAKSSAESVLEMIKGFASHSLPRSECLRLLPAASRGRAPTTRPQRVAACVDWEAEHLLHDFT
jgi:hypothetical protein